jgi:hypothetical protein
LAKWDSFFPISYYQYRQKLKNLSIRSFRSTGLKTELPPNFVDGTNYINKPYLPTDDDDWYHPSIGNEVAIHFKNPKIKLVYWQAWIFHLSENSTYDGRMFCPFTEHTGKWMASNGYAVRSNNWNCYIGHLNNRLAYYKPEEVVYVDKPLSVWVQHPASIWELQSFDKPNTKLTKKQPIPNELEWAAGYIETSYEFTNDALRC